MKKLSCIILVALICLSAKVTIASEDQTAQAQPETYSATIVWETDKPSTSQVEYGSDTTFGSKTAEDPALVTRHTIVINNLPATTTIHYRVISVDIFGNESISDDFTLITEESALAKVPPKISAVESVNIAASAKSPEPVASEYVKTLDQPIKLKDSEAENIVAAGPGDEDIDPDAAPEFTGDPESLVKKEVTIQRTLFRTGGVLLPKGNWKIDSEFTYAHLSANNISIQGVTILPVLVIGEISSETVKRDIFIQTFTSHYGLTDNLQWDLRVPLRGQHERVTSSDGSESSRSKGGLGDIETGLFYQFMHEEGGKPDLIAGLTVKSDTGESPYGESIGVGTGHWATKAGLTWVKSADPAILFGNLGYTWNIPRDINDYGKVNPGDTISYGLGLAFSLNYQLSLNFGLEQHVTQKMEVDDNMVAGSFTNVANFKTGVSWLINRKIPLQITAGYGLTEDAPDFTLEVNFPIRF